MLLGAIGLAILWLVPAWAEGGTRVRVSLDECRRLTEHRPVPGVEYREGVDARGRPVAPADMEGSRPLALPEHYTIDLAIPLADLGAGPPAVGAAELVVGKIRIEGSRVFFNDQPIGDTTRDALIRACGALLRKR